MNAQVWFPFSRYAIDFPSIETGYAQPVVSQILKSQLPQMSNLGLNTARHCHCPNNGPPGPGFSLPSHARPAEGCFNPCVFPLCSSELEAVSAPVTAFPVTPRGGCSQFCHTLGTVSCCGLKVPFSQCYSLPRSHRHFAPLLYGGALQDGTVWPFRFS